MQKYIHEQIHPVNLGADRTKAVQELLAPMEIRDYRSLCLKIQWVARECRPDVAGSASRLNSALPTPTVADFNMANKVARDLRGTSRVNYKIWSLDVSTLVFLTASDAGGPGSAR